MECKIGRIILKNQLENHEKNYIVPFLQSKKWLINWMQPKNQIWYSIFPIINETTITQMILINYQSITNILLKKISHIQFSQLNILQLNNNKIINIELLSKMYIPKIKKIELSIKILQKNILDNNYIHSLQCLNICCFPDLKSLNLQNNPIREVQTLIKIDMDLETLKILSLSQQNTIICDDKGWIAKMQNKYIKRLHCFSSIGINAPLKADMLVKKFKNLVIYHSMWV